jgi:hypothetical protein
MAAGLQQSCTVRGPLNLYLDWDVFQHGQHGDRVKGPVVWQVLGKVPREQFASVYFHGTIQRGINANYFANQGVKLPKERAIGAADVKNPRTA